MAPGAQAREAEPGMLFSYLLVLSWVCGTPGLGANSATAARDMVPVSFGELPGLANGASAPSRDSREESLVWVHLGEEGNHE